MNKTKALKENLWVILILTFALAFRLALLNHCLWVDEARDLSITYNLIHKGVLTPFNGAWYFQHPILQYLFLIPGVAMNSELVATFTIALISLLGVFGVYVIGKELFNKKVGLLSAFLISSQPIFLFYSVRILNNITHTTMIILSFMFLILYINRKNAKFAGLSIAFSLFALTTRITSFFLPILIGIILLIKNKKILRDRWVYIGVLIGVTPLLFWFGINYIHTGKFFEISVWQHHLKEGILDWGPWSYYLANFVNIYTISLTVLFAVSILIHWLRKFKNTKILFLWFIAYFIVISWVAVKVPRYTLPTMAPLILISVSGIYYISKIKGIPKEAEYIIIIILIGIGFWWSYNGYLMVKYKSVSFCGLKEVAGVIDGHKTFAGSSTEISWYAKRNVLSLPRNLTSFENSVKPGDYIEVDLWERTQPRYIFSLIMRNQSNFKLIYAWPLYSKNKFVYLFEYV